MRVKVLRQESPQSKPYWEAFDYDGPTNASVAEVLDYVQFSPKKLVRSVETWATASMKAGIITPEEGREFLSNYRSGLYGYTYLESE